ncbi:hypothetical protein VTL71DRAFT_11651 [Oculimacula yallundae]|uniref:Uncharacterized protein n=1 Tax=Oculimacula yallundae TaxID=86028 RepID=A0ABR4CSH5_9HELO
MTARKTGPAKTGTGTVTWHSSVAYKPEADFLLLELAQ